MRCKLGELGEGEKGSKILEISFLLTLTISLITFDLEGLEKFCLQFWKLDECAFDEKAIQWTAALMNYHFDELPTHPSQVYNFYI